MLRNVQPELLDSLDPSDPGALANRRDLLLINQLMGTYRWFGKLLPRLGHSSIHALELGAGDGALGHRLHKRMRFGSYTAVDLIPAPENWPDQALWHQGDLLEYNSFGCNNVLLANLILHHFEDDQLARLGARIQDSGIRHILASEPCRRSMHKWQLRAGSLLGFHPVTLYDGCISIDGGFQGEELPAKLGLSTRDWTWTIQTTFMGAYRWAASRKGAATVCDQ